eukprot:14194478-Ditylum_brightwellii.AAC.1
MHRTYVRCYSAPQIKRLVAPVKNSEEILARSLEVKDRLLAIECTYPYFDDLHKLLRVWLRGNELPWDPAIFDDKCDMTVPSCWDREPEFDEANSNDE